MSLLFWHWSSCFLGLCCWWQLRLRHKTNWLPWWFIDGVGGGVSSERQHGGRRNWPGKLLKLLSLGVYRKFPPPPLPLPPLILSQENFLCVSSVSLPWSLSMAESCYAAQAGLELGLSPRQGLAMQPRLVVLNLNLQQPSYPILPNAEDFASLCN